MEKLPWDLLMVELFPFTVHPFICSLFTCSSVRPFTRSPIHSFTRLHVHPFTRSPVAKVHSCIRLSPELHSCICRGGFRRQVPWGLPQTTLTLPGRGGDPPKVGLRHPGGSVVQRAQGPKRAKGPTRAQGPKSVEGEAFALGQPLRPRGDTKATGQPQSLGATLKPWGNP